MLKAYKYRIYPNNEQEILINKTLGCARFVYNHILSYKIDSYKNEGKSLSKIDCNNYCNRVLKNDHPFLREVDKFALTNSIYNMDSSFQKFFKEGAGFPKFKNKHSLVFYLCIFTFIILLICSDKRNMFEIRQELSHKFSLLLFSI